jgi:hypothetical protein
MHPPEIKDLADDQENHRIIIRTVSAKSGAGARAVAAAEGVRAAARGPPSTRMKSEPGPPMTLGGAAAAGVRIIVWCKGCLAATICWPRDIPSA